MGDPRLGRPAVLDAVAVAVVWAFVAFASTAQSWTGLDTPDSEFYASLGMFGHDITDRAIYTVYYWTRLGTIGPVRVLTEWFGTWTGYHLFWLLLVAVVVAAVFVMARRFTTRLPAALLAALVALNSVVLGMLGNPYVSGTAMAATFVVIAGLAYLVPLPDDGRGPRPGSATWAPLVVGGGMGWLAMTNPYATMLAAAVTVVAVSVITAQTRSLRVLVRQLLLAVAGAIVVFAALLLVGRLLFPGLDWIETNVYWSQVLNSADYVSDLTSFVKDVYLVVPLAAAAVAVVIVAVRPRDHVRQLAVVLAPSAMVFGLGFLVLSPSNTLEIPHYQALQWPPALAGLVLAVAAVVGRRAAPPWGVAVMVSAVLGTIVAGHWTGTMNRELGWLVAALVAAVVAIAIVRSPRVVVTVVALGVLFAAFQLLQNAHRPLTFTAESPYANAFQPNDVRAKLESAHDAQAWLISETAPDDDVMVWVDAEWGVDETLLPMAAFQLWGANQVTPLPTLYGPELDRARSLGVDVIALYGRSMEPIITFWSTLPREVGHSDLDCTEYPWPDPAAPTAHVCLTRLTWS